MTWSRGRCGAARPGGAKEAASYPAEPVDSGPVFDNVVVKGEIDFLAFPSPLWHEKDGTARYIGTGCAVVTTDPGTGGCPTRGAYRIEVQDDGAAVSINMEAGQARRPERAGLVRRGRAARRSPSRSATIRCSSWCRAPRCRLACRSLSTPGRSCA